MATTSSIPGLLRALRDGLRAMPDLVDVAVYIAPLGDGTRLEEVIAFGEIFADDSQAGIGMTSMFEEYTVPGKINVRYPGAGEDAIDGALDRLFLIVGAIQEFLADSPLLSSVVRIDFRGGSVLQWAEDRERWAAMKFSIGVEAHISPT